ncbi:MAG: hypothetical protein ABI440_12090 [Casimicrobiaceae bacterium]
MGLFKIFDTTEIDAFANVLAADLARRYPPASEKRTDAGAQNQLNVILQGLGVRAARFRDQQKLGIYGKAKLANVFKWKLKEAGFTDGFIHVVTKELATRLAVKS